MASHRKPWTCCSCSTRPRARSLTPSTRRRRPPCGRSCSRCSTKSCGPSPRCRSNLVVAVGFLESPGATGIAVDVLDVTKAPPDLGGRVRLPVRARAGHLAARQRLRYAVRAAGVFRVVAPAALPVPDVLQAAEIGLRAEAEAGQDAVGGGLRGARIGWRGRDRSEKRR